MNETEYLKNRIEDQINWYGKKSTINKKWFRMCQLTQLIMATLITLSGTIPINDYPWVQIIVPVLGGIIAVISGLLGLFKFQENWLEYRTVCESLKHEKFLFLTKSDPYNLEGPLNLLVSRVETLISKENTNWAQYMRKEPQKKE